MKKFLFLNILTMLLPYSLYAMNMQRILRPSSRFEFQKRSYSGYNSPKSLGTLSFDEVNKLAYNKELAQKELNSALARNEDVKIAPISQQSSGIQNLWRKTFRSFSTKAVQISTQESTEVKDAWKKIFAQFSIQNWNSMLLEREEQSILEAIDRRLPDFVKKINFKDNQDIDKRIERVHAQVKLCYGAQPFDEPLQQYYQENLLAAGYNSKISNIYQWNHKHFKASCIHPHIYVTSDFFDFPLEERLGILAHEDQHAKNFHIYKKLNICSFLEEKNTPNGYLHFIEKEADLKAGAHNIAIATGLLNFFRIWKEITGNSQERKKLESSSTERPKETHPLLCERISYMQDLIVKLEQEQKGYAWNPFHKILGLPEWFKK